MTFFRGRRNERKGFLSNTNTIQVPCWWLKVHIECGCVNCFGDNTQVCTGITNCVSHIIVTLKAFVYQVGQLL